MRYFSKNINVDYPQGVHCDTYQPVLHCYIQDESPELKLSGKRKAVIVCPGGAYRFKSDREGEPIAVRFLASGMQAFVLQYSVSPNRYPAALLELAAAVGMVREHAAEWFIDPEQIFVCGFSAGGHLCASLGTMWNEPMVWERICHDAEQCRPDGMILCYPVISMQEDFGHEECRRLLMGEALSEEFSAYLSLQNRVSAATVPAFIWATQQDEQVPVENSMMFAAELQKNHVPMELHIYEEGEHGLALCDVTTEDKSTQIKPDNAGWMQQAVRWINRRQV